MVYTTKLTSKSQIVVPAEVRRHLGLKPGDRGVWIIKEDEAAFMSPEAYARRTAGILTGIYGRSREEIEDYLGEERGGWE